MGQARGTGLPGWTCRLRDRGTIRGAAFQEVVSRLLGSGDRRHLSAIESGQCRVTAEQPARFSERPAATLRDVIDPFLLAGSGRFSGR